MYLLLYCSSHEYLKGIEENSMSNLEKILIKILDPIVKNKKLRYKLNVLWGRRPNIRYRCEDKSKYNKDKKEYCKLNGRKNFEFKEEYEYPILGEWRGQAGYPGSYFWQDLWGGSKVAEKIPDMHFDIGSRIDGFISHLLVLKVPVTLIDIRPLDKKIPGVEFLQADATELDSIADDTISSLSALCSLEHFGLGRYGDTIDPEACYKAFRAIQRVVKPGGYIYLSLPIGKERLCFNAHRVFDPHTVIQEFSKCELEEYSVIDLSEDPVLIKNCDLRKYADAETSQMGLFCFQKGERVL